MSERANRRIELPEPLYQRLVAHAAYIDIPVQTLCRLLLAEQMDRHAPDLAARVIHREQGDAK